MSAARNPSGARATTAKSVADLAQVSVTTVSRVLNGQTSAIPSETQQRVVDAAAELNYRPNSLAKALRSGTTQTIGLVVPDIADAYFHQVARAVEDVAQAADCVVMLLNTDRVPEREEACVNLLLDRRVDGIVFAGGGIDDDTHLAGINWGTARVMAIGPHQLPYPVLTVDDGAAIADAVHHLANVGCSTILCLAGQPNWLVTQQRLAGYREAVAELELAKRNELISYGEFSEKSGEERTAKAIEQGQFDGVVAFNDYCAIGAMRALHAAGIRVPDDVAVVGCDDIPVSELVSPTLSSISFSQYDLGRQAAQMILHSTEPYQHNVTVFPHAVIHRDSTAREPPR